MLRELISIFRQADPIGEMAAEFAKMLQRSLELTLEAGKIFFGSAPTQEQLDSISQRDVKVNKLQRKIRKRVITHLSVAGNSQDLPYCLLLMSLVKDVERIGDYAKDLSDVREFGSTVVPNDPGVAELREIASAIESIFQAAPEVLGGSDRKAAIELIRNGREIVDRCESLLRSTPEARRDLGAQTTIILGTQYYKRIAGHLLNILSGVVVPLHRLDYYDEKDLRVAATQSSSTN